MTTAPIIPTDAPQRFYVLRKDSFAYPSECDGCGKNTRNGYTIVYVSPDAPASIAGWACRTDCAQNTVNDQECNNG